jgi:hypothetical protein
VLVSERYTPLISRMFFKAGGADRARREDVPHELKMVMPTLILTARVMLN